MNKTKIEWCDYTINPVKGLCPMACLYCYTRAMYKRFKWNPEIRFDLNTICPLPEMPSGSRIFVGSTIELFGEWVKGEWLSRIFQCVRAYSRHTFIFLTKQPQNLIKWSPFPENCWVGVTATNTSQYEEALQHSGCYSASIKFLSLEPLFEQISITTPIEFYPFNWLIIGQQTPISANTQPKIEWIQEIIEAADKVGIPIFLKNNLDSILPATQPFYTPRGYGDRLRQEFPK